MEVFAIFEDIFDSLECSNSPTINKIIPALKMVRDDLKINPVEDPTLEQESIMILKQKLTDQVNFYIGPEIRPEYKIATFLDPGYRKMVSGDVFNEIKNFAELHGLLDTIDPVILLFKNVTVVFVSLFYSSLLKY